MPSVLLFGDAVGLPRLLEAVGEAPVLALVRAENRPQYERPLTELAQRRGLELLTQPRREAPGYGEFVERLRALAPDLIAVDSYSMLLRPDVLELPALGAVNVHYAPLPRYRGPNPTQWAILNGETETAVTIHHMSDEVDAGDIVAQSSVPIGFAETWVEVTRRLDRAAEELLREQLPLLLTGTASRTPQDEALATRFGRRTPEDGAIDWDWPVIRIYNLIRALVSPLPGAFFEQDGERVPLDRYLTPVEVAALKFGAAGGRRLQRDEVRLTPAPRDGGDPTLIEFSVERARDRSALGRCALELDAAQGTARVALDQEGDVGEAVGSLLVRFAGEELLLDRDAVGTG